MEYHIFTSKIRYQEITLTFYFEALPGDTTPKPSIRILGIALNLTSYSGWHKDFPFDLGAFILQLQIDSPPRLVDEKIVVVHSSILHGKGSTSLDRALSTCHPAFSNWGTQLFIQLREE